MNTILHRPGVELFVRFWTPAEDIEVRGVVQIAHGMVEHAARYEDFARFLNEQGFVVIAQDHRGHGKTIGSRADMGYFTNGWAAVVDDMHAVRQWAQLEFPEASERYFMLGHSMGSVLVRDYIARYGNGLAGAIIVGTLLWPKATGPIGLRLAQVLASNNPHGEAKLLNTMAFAGYNKGFEGDGQFTWLSRDPQVVADYEADELCGFIPTNKFFLHLLGASRRVNQRCTYKATRIDLPVFIISGAKDPVGGARAVKVVAHRYQQRGLQDVQSKAYKGGRHEILNETNKQEVYADVAHWLEEHLA